MFHSLSTGLFDVCFNQPPVDWERRQMAKEHADLKRCKPSVRREVSRALRIAYLHHPPICDRVHPKFVSEDGDLKYSYPIKQTDLEKSQ
jgi:hypothetical protein